MKLGDFFGEQWLELTLRFAVGHPVGVDLFDAIGFELDHRATAEFAVGPVDVVAVWQSDRDRQRDFITGLQ